MARAFSHRELQGLVIAIAVRSVHEEQRTVGGRDGWKRRDRGPCGAAEAGFRYRVPELTGLHQRSVLRQVWLIRSHVPAFQVIAVILNHVQLQRKVGANLPLNSG